MLVSIRLLMNVWKFGQTFGQTFLSLPSDTGEQHLLMSGCPTYFADTGLESVAWQIVASHCGKYTAEQNSDAYDTCVTCTSVHNNTLCVNIRYKKSAACPGLLGDSLTCPNVNTETTLGVFIIAQIEYITREFDWLRNTKWQISWKYIFQDIKYTNIDEHMHLLTVSTIVAKLFDKKLRNVFRHRLAAP